MAEEWLSLGAALIGLAGLILLLRPVPGASSFQRQPRTVVHPGLRAAGFRWRGPAGSSEGARPFGRPKE